MNDYPKPLTPAVYHILLALAEGPRPGYAITAQIDEHTSGSIRMGPGTLYGSLRRMQGWGLVEPLKEAPAGEEDAADGRGASRRYYEITALGKGALREEAERLDHAVELARRYRVLGGGA